MRSILFILSCLMLLPAEGVAKTDNNAIIENVEELTELNDELVYTDFEKTVNQILKEKAQLLGDLFVLLRTTSIDRIDTVVYKNRLDTLRSRVAINTERGNKLAVQRDQLKIARYENEQDIRAFLNYLIDASRSYKTAKEIVNHAKEELNDISAVEKKLIPADSDTDGKVVADVKANYLAFQPVYNTYKDILEFTINHPDKITSTSWFQNFSLLSIIAYFNNIDAIRPVNHKLAPIRIDMGGIIVSLFIFVLVTITYPLVVRGSGWLIDNFVLQNETSNSDIIYHGLRRPVLYLLLFFSFDLATYALFYKTEYKDSLQNFNFIVYTCIYVWLFFKVLDSIFIAQIDNLSRANKEARKELINLGMQTAKGIVIVVAITLILNHFGISIAAIMSTLGIGGLAFALAAKDTLSNLFGGITVLIDDVFRMGDWVKIGDREGTVAEIGLRSTTIRTFDNALVTIPNSTISTSNVMNWNRRAVGRRIKLYVGVTYESNMGDLRQALEDIRSMLREHSDIANPSQKHTSNKRKFRFSSHEDTQGIKSTQLVFMDRYNDFSIDILIYCFSKTVNWAEWLSVKEDVLFKIAEILKNNHLEFAYPTAVRVYRSQPQEGVGVEPFLGDPVSDQR